MEVQRVELLLIIRALVYRIRFSLLIPVDKRIIISQSISSRSFNNWPIQINNSRVRLNHIEMKMTEMVRHLHTEI